MRVQTALRVSSPADPAEREAESTAKRIMRMALADRLPGPSGPPVAPRPPIGRSPAPEVRRKAEGLPDVGANVAAEIQASDAAGQPLPASVRRFMEPRFRADFGGVRIHTSDRAATLNRQLAARAFTVGRQVFFGRDQFRPENEEGQELIAHELTHTIQQGGRSTAAARTQRVRRRRRSRSSASASATRSTTSPTRRTTSRASGCSPSSSA